MTIISFNENDDTTTCPLPLPLPPLRPGSDSSIVLAVPSAFDGELSWLTAALSWWSGDRVAEANALLADDSGTELEVSFKALLDEELALTSLRSDVFLLRIGEVLSRSAMSPSSLL